MEHSPLLEEALNGYINEQLESLRLLSLALVDRKEQEQAVRLLVEHLRGLYKVTKQLWTRIQVGAIKPYASFCSSIPFVDPVDESFIEGKYYFGHL